MENRQRIELSLRAAMLAKDVLSLLECTNPLTAELTLTKAIPDMNKLGQWMQQQGMMSRTK